jgi:hypothetical protein
VLSALYLKKIKKSNSDSDSGFLKISHGDEAILDSES